MMTENNKVWPRCLFTDLQVHAASEAWGLNCGPSAVAAVLQYTLEEIRPHLGDFEQKHYTNPTLMYQILNNLKAVYSDVGCLRGHPPPWPGYGLARVQWEGPWTKPGVPIRARYRHTHWVGVCGEMIYDVNAMSVGGWITRQVWRDQLVPWLLKEVVPRADGKWHLTHAIEIERRKK